jgi:DNA-binding NtrC family response regulator
MMLGRARVLIVEDDALIADELAAAVERADGEVLGPVATVEDGLAIVAEEIVAAAILDVHLRDRDVAPIATVLLSRRLPVVFHTGSELPPTIIERFGDAAVCPKPMDPDQVVLRLLRMMTER